MKNSPHIGGVLRYKKWSRDRDLNPGPHRCHALLVICGAEQYKMHLVV